MQILVKNQNLLDMIYHTAIALKLRDSGLKIKSSKFCVIEIKILLDH